MTHEAPTQKLLKGFQRLATGDLSYRLPLNSEVDDEKEAVVLFNAMAAEFENKIRAKQNSEERLNNSLGAISEALLQVGAGNLDVHIQRDYQGDSVDILAFLVDTTISELRVLEAENKRRNADELEKIIRKMQVSEERLNNSMGMISEALLQVGTGKLDVRIQRDYQGDPIDILAFLVDTTISELRILEAEKLERNANIQAELETQVAERTRDLLEANNRLQKDMAEIEALQQKLREQAIRDPLTNLFNRRYLQEALNHEIARATRDKSPLSLITIDLDHFKTINDTFGHKGGDVALKALSELLNAQTRDADIACRFGGEEFILILPGASFDMAKKRAEQLRKKYKAMQMEHAGKIMRNTFSAGIASFPVHGETSDELLINADRALYAAKQAGRDRVVGWQG